MKPLLLLLALLAATFSNSYATIRTLSNDPNGGTQFSDLASAYNASSNTDTILVEGTNISYTNTNLNKNLVIIGIGFNPQKTNPRHTLFAGTVTMAVGASGSRFYGIEFTGAVGLNSGAYSGIIFEDCKFNSVFDFNFGGAPTASNLLFRNCIFDVDNGQNIIFSTSSNLNILLTNCSFDGYLNGNSNSLLGLTIDHCHFLTTTQSPLQNMQNINIKNCVFMNQTTLQSGTSTGNTFFNNISRLGGLPSGNGNINTTNPNFVTYTTGTMYSTAHDYHLQSGSAAIMAGSDSTDIGIHGGFTNFNEKGEPLITPIMRSLIILNTTVAPNGTLNIQINASKPNDN